MVSNSLLPGGCSAHAAHNALEHWGTVEREGCEAAGPSTTPAALSSGAPSQPPAPLSAQSPGDAGPGWESQAAAMPTSLPEDPLALPSQLARNSLPWSTSGESRLDRFRWTKGGFAIQWAPSTVLQSVADSQEQNNKLSHSLPPSICQRSKLTSVQSFPLCSFWKSQHRAPEPWHPPLPGLLSKGIFFQGKAQANDILSL